jgi:hypothetical protein
LFDTYAPGYFRYEIRCRTPDGAESVLTKGHGFVTGLAVSTDGRVALAVIDTSPERGGEADWSMKVIDLDSHAEHVFPRQRQVDALDLAWSRDEGSILFTALDWPKNRDTPRADQPTQGAPVMARRTICELDTATGELRTLGPGSYPVPVLGGDGVGLAEDSSYRVIDEKTGSTVRTAANLPGAELPYQQQYLIAAPGPERVIYKGLPPPGTRQLTYFPGTEEDLTWWRMWSVHMADLSNGKVATIVWQTYAYHVVFSRVDLAQALPIDR